MSRYRPERVAPPATYYDEKEAFKYTSNSRIILIQRRMAERCVELLALPGGGAEGGGHRLLLDVGCGSGLSGEVLSDEGHAWVGLDISPSMLDVAVERGAEGDLLLHDAGGGFGFRSGVFDGAISVSALQWLCYSDRSDHLAGSRLATFFASLYKCLRRGARAVLQVYPESPEQLELMTTAALKAGFTGGLVVDFPNSTKAKKHFLCLFAGVDASAVSLPAGLTEEAGAGGVSYEGSRVRLTARKGTRHGALRAPVKSKEWIKAKKTRQGAVGKEVRPDSKYSGRKRGPKF